MSEPRTLTSFWKRALEIDRSPELGALVFEALDAIFQKYEQAAKEEESDSMLVDDQDVVDDDADADDADDDDMSSADSYVGSPIPNRRLVVFEDSDSDNNTMSTSHTNQHRRPAKTADFEVEWEPVKWPSADPQDTGVEYKQHKGDVTCPRCKAYDAHCKSAAENYKRTLDNYTKTVAELMAGFKKVLERYPELKVDCSDERLYYMVQAALGRNNLVREMVRLSAVSAMRTRDSSLGSGGGEIAAVYEALNTCYSDRDAVRLVLDKYADLYVRYVQVWREMCAKVSRDITVMELLTCTEGRPGVAHGEPWCEARAYVRRVQERSRGLAPRSLADYCVDKLKDLDAKLTRVPRDPGVCREDAELLLETLRQRLDLEADRCASDSHMTDLFLDIWSNLTVLHTLIGVGVLSAKTLLHERHLLVCQIRKLCRTQGFSSLVETK